MMKRMVILRRCHPPPPPAVLPGGCGGVRYGECRRNHAASTGGHAVDGCREFLAEGADGTAAALRCAACGCHRSFHHRVARRCCCFICRDDDDASAPGARWRVGGDGCSPESSASSTTPR